MSPAHSDQPTERRRRPRLCEELLIPCRNKDTLSQTIHFTRNISGGGLMFGSPEPIPMGTQLEIELYAPLDCEKQTMRYMRIGAQVRWVSDMPNAFGYEGSNRYKVGVVFDEIDPQDQARFDEYVKKRLNMVVNTEHVARTDLR